MHWSLGVPHYTNPPYLNLDHGTFGDSNLKPLVPQTVQMYTHHHTQTKPRPLGHEQFQCNATYWAKYLKNVCFFLLKGWLTGFFLGLIVFMGCSLACVHACFFKKRIIFHIIYLYSTPLCPSLTNASIYFLVYEAPPSMGWDWLAGSVCCDWLNRL